MGLNLNLYRPTARVYCSRAFHLVSTREGAPTVDETFSCEMPTAAKTQTATTAPHR